YRMTLAQNESQAEQLTRFESADVDDFDVSADGKLIVFSMWDRLYRLDLDRAAEGPVAIDIRADEDTSDRVQLKSADRLTTQTAVNPDGKSIATINYGQVYIRGTEAKASARRLTKPPARHRDVTFSADGQTLFFVSDESGIESIYAATVKLTRGDVKKQVTEAAKKKPASQPTTDLSEHGDSAAPNDATADVPADLASASTQQSEPNDRQKEAATSDAPPADKAKAEKKKEDSRWPDAISFDIKPLITTAQMNRDPSPSPCGKWLAFQRGAGQLWLHDLATGTERLLVDGWSDSLEWHWSSDSKRIAYITEDVNNNADVWIINTDGETPAVNISRHPDNESSPRFSADGKVLAFTSSRVDNESDVWMVFLDKSLESFTTLELEKYYEEANAAVKKREPVKVRKAATQPATEPTTKPDNAAGDATADADAETSLDLADAYLRLRRVTTLPGNEGSLLLAPAGDKFYFTAQNTSAPAAATPAPGPGANRSTYVVDKEGDPKRIGGSLNLQAFTLTGDKILVIDSGRPALMKLPGGELEPLDISDKFEIDLAAQSRQKFLEAARMLGVGFYDPKLNGMDYPAVTARYAELAGKAVTASEFDHVADKFVGEFNSSHQGVNSPAERNDLQQPMGRLGIQRQRVEDGYKVTDVYERGPAAKGSMKLLVGDIIISVDGSAVAENQTLEQALLGKVGRESLLTVRRVIDGEPKEINLLLTPISSMAESALFYDTWRTRRAAKVAEMSDGKIGYIHIRGMDQSSLDVFERDLYAAADGKKGLIIDVRNNGGGWTADRLLASIMYPRHAYTRPRGVSDDVKGAYPNDRLFITRYDLPINMLCNEKSFSNAEIISHAFKTLKRGTLVGQQTAGGVISTGGASLIDGTTVRMPGRGWFTPAGVNMELNGAMPDLLVTQTPESEAANDDQQLRAAVDDLLKRLD
ncbi:MAG TPA: S41 family peptidase, partial [Tepidisphaeraceae bacterium]|nr:S41 family peptidase [Tepidisphaeraceae bacterium]